MSYIGWAPDPKSLPGWRYGALAEAKTGTSRLFLVQKPTDGPICLTCYWGNW